MSENGGTPRCIIEDFRHEVKVTPAMLPLLVYLCAIIPPVYELGKLGAWCGFIAGLGLSWAVVPRWRPALWLLYLFGVMWGQQCTLGRNQTYLQQIPREDCHLEAIVRIGGNPLPPSEFGSRQSAEIVQLRLGGCWESSGGTIMAVFPSGVNPAYGDTFHVRGPLMRSPGNNYGRHLKSMGFFHVLDVEAVFDHQSATGWRRYWQQFLNWRYDLGRRITNGMSKRNGDLYQSMILGRKDLFRNDIRTLFLRSSTLHIFAISGLHVGIIFLCLTHTFQRIGCGYRGGLVASTVVSIVYVLLTGTTPSAIRSIIMVVLLVIPKLIMRGLNTRHTLCLAAWFELLYNPMYLHHSGFLFSFIVVAALVYGSLAAEDIQNALLERCRWLPPTNSWLRPKKWKTFICPYAVGLAIAWSASLPLSLFMNGIIPFGSLVIGFQAQLLSFLLVGAALPKLAVDALLPELSNLMGRALDCLMETLTFLAQIGGHDMFCTHRPYIDGGTCAYFLVCLILCLACWKRRLIRYTTIFLMSTWFAWVLLQIPSERLEIAVSQGDDASLPAICIIDKRNNSITVVSGGTRPAAQILADHLRNQGVQAIDELFLPVHGEAKRGARFLQKQFQTNAVRFNELPPDKLTASLTAQGIHVMAQSLDPTQNPHADNMTDIDTFRLDYRDATVRITLGHAPCGYYVLNAACGKNARTLLLKPSSKTQVRRFVFRLPH